MTVNRKYQGNKGLEYYKAYPRDFFEGTVGMKGPLKGFYRMVVDLIYMHDGYLLDDWNHISGHTGFGRTQCRRMMDDLINRAKIESICTENEQFFINKRAVSELKTSRKFQENQRNKALNMHENKGLGMDAASQNEVPEGVPPQDHKPTIQNPVDSLGEKTMPDFLPLFGDDMKKDEADPPKPKPKRAKPSVAMPQDWVPSDKNVEDALKLNFSQQDIQNEADRFKDHHLSKGSTFKDWNAAWRTWLRNSRKFNTQGGGKMGRGTSPSEIADRGAAIAERQQAKRRTDPIAGEGQY
tara:strand:- start:18999 stop:19886 length:888 start_codon:yes stop_codon:yes gene_type:complete